MSKIVSDNAIIRSIFVKSGTLLRYEPGQLLSDSSYIPSKVLLINSGTARLIGQHNSRLSPIDRLGHGEIVGALSILRLQACELIRAAEELTAYAIDDNLFFELIKNDLVFQRAVMKTLFKAEVLELAQRSASKSSSRDELVQIYNQLLNNTSILLAADQSDLCTSKEKDGVYYMSINRVGDSEGIKSGDIVDASALTFSKELDGIQYRLVHVTIPHEKSKDASVMKTYSTELVKAPQKPYASSLGIHNDNCAIPEIVLAKGGLNQAMAVFQMLSSIFDLPFRKDAIEKILKQYADPDNSVSMRLFAQIASGLNLHVTTSSVTVSEIERLETPSLIEWKGCVSIAVQNSNRGLKVASPSLGYLTLTSSDFLECAQQSIEVVHLEQTASTQQQRFGFKWFLPALKRYKQVLLQVLVATFVVQLFTLANPLLIQVVIDKVITQRSLDTLQVLGIALVAVTIFEGVLGSLKTFLFAETTNRLDQRLGAEVIDHLLRLPLSYFDKRPVGELGSRISELEKIRNFLTGQALTTIIDALFSVIYIIVMLFYSLTLTAVALAVLPIQIGLTLLGAPIFRRQYRDSAEANAKTQSHLVEVLTGIQTVKSQNVEMMSRTTWQEHYSNYINKTFAQTVTGTSLSQASQVLQKISQLVVLWVGAILVLQGSLTLGQLIAFRIISGYVTQPLLRLSSIWQSVQELRVSFERLADVINTPQESSDTDKGKIPLPMIKGGVSFENVSFSFSQTSQPVLRNISLDIIPGTFVGVVGQSGSGKSTLMKLLPRLYKPDSGRILIDGNDIWKVELYSIRRQLGIVPQDPLLFSGTILENIALTQPDATNDQIVLSSKMACAHDFIMQLPDGYSTRLGERGSSLSGGQRQRIAVARTLLARPQLLIMDEATSALDYETERLLCDNLISGLGDRTVFFVTHRLTTVRRADMIVVMHQGSVAEKGTHDELMSLQGRYYALYRQQESQ